MFSAIQIHFFFQTVVFLGKWGSKRERRGREGRMPGV
jgi:hypothetical protein